MEPEGEGRDQQLRISNRPAGGKPGEGIEGELDG